MNIAVVGTGFIAPVHIEALRRANQNVVAVLGTSKAKAGALADAWGVATFYAMFSVTPQPKTIVRVCDDIACRLSGGRELLAELRKIELEGSVKPSPCLGLCERAPAVLVQTAEEGVKDYAVAPAMAVIEQRRPGRRRGSAPGRRDPTAGKREESGLVSFYGLEGASVLERRADLMPPRGRRSRIPLHGDTPAGGRVEHAMSSQERFKMLRERNPAWTSSPARLSDW